MTPYVDLKPAKCMYCENAASAKIVFIKTGLFMIVCADHFRQIAEGLEK